MQFTVWGFGLMRAFSFGMSCLAWVPGGDCMFAMGAKDVQGFDQRCIEDAVTIVVMKLQWEIEHGTGSVMPSARQRRFARHSVVLFAPSRVTTRWAPGDDRGYG